MPVLDRYLLKEVLQTWLAVSVVLLVVIVSNQLVRYLGDVGSGDLPPDVIASLLGFSALRYLVLLLPVSLYLAVLLVLGRWYRDSELDVLFACGVGFGRLYRPLAALGVPVAVGLGLLSLSVVPWAERAETQIRERVQNAPEIHMASAGSFRESGARDLVYYVERLSADRRHMRNVFVQSRQHGELGVLTARTAHLERDGETGQRFLVLENGHRYEGTPGRADYRVVRFERYGLAIEEPRPSEGPSDLEGRPSRELWGASDPESQAELQWRLSTPVSALVLMLLAVPLARTAPRRGRYGNLVVAVLVYLVYFNLIGMSRSWVEQGALSAAAGLWWVHGAVALAGLALLVSQMRLRWLRRRAPPPAGGGT